MGSQSGGQEGEGEGGWRPSGENKVECKESRGMKKHKTRREEEEHAPGCSHEPFVPIATKRNAL